MHNSPQEEMLSYSSGSVTLYDFGDDSITALSGGDLDQVVGGLLWFSLLARAGGGAVIGAGAELAGHFSNGGSLSNVDWGSVGVAAGTGAVGGGFSRYVKVKG